MPSLSPDRLLEDLNEAQREAVQVASGPLAIVAGAGTGKTRVISRRAAFAVAFGVVAAERVLLVSFTEKAAAEMVARMAALGVPGVTARTFHAHALTQLRWFWPSRHDGAPLPDVLESKLRLLVPLVGRLPGGYRFTPAKDVADVIEWAKVRRIPPDRWLDEGGDRAPIPADLFARLYRDYERAKARAGAVDFEDMLTLAVELLETDDEARELVQSRKTWVSVDEYQDTNPLGERLLELWLGESRDLAVVGDPDQTIYTFTGATPDFLLDFAARHPGARTVALTENYRSTPEVLALANRVAGAGPRPPLTATRSPGPPPTLRGHPDADAELAALVTGIRARLREGTRPDEIAVLVRMNAQLPPIEEALTRAGVPFAVRGQRFWERREVREARTHLRRAPPRATGAALVAAMRTLLAERMGYGGDGDDAGTEARERAASLEVLLGIAEDLVRSDPDADGAALLGELDRRAEDEASRGGAGVNLLTYHRAKGLEWDAVFLPALEEGTLPIRHAKSDDALAEERRLLYVGITRARVHLALSWAERRPSPSGGVGTRRPSRFLDALRPARPRTAPLPSAARPRSEATAADGPLLDALRAWRRERARADAVPAYVVATDATLAAIADERPGTVAALRRVKGMGPVRLEQYGPEILEIVARGEVQDGRRSPSLQRPPAGSGISIGSTPRDDRARST